MNVRRWIAAIAIFAVVAGGFGLAIAVINAAKQPAPPPATAQRPALTLPPKVPIPVEFQLGVVVTDENCAGPNGCVYKYRVEPKYHGQHPLPDKEFKVIYRVTGGHQPQTGDFTVRDGQASVLADVAIEGPPDAHLQAVVTQIVG